MRKFWFLKIAFFVALAFFVFGFATMFLWNSLIPDLFHGPVITFWQAFGLVVLSKILFHGFGGMRGGRCGSHHQWRSRWKEKWDMATPEQREQWRKKWEGRCGNWKFPAEEEKATTA